MDTKELLRAYYDLSPANVQLAIQELVNNPNVIISLGAKHNVEPEKNEILKSEIFMILLGLQPLSDFRTNLVQELDITYDQALKIAFDANAQIFGPVMDDLKEIQEGIKEEDALPITSEEPEQAVTPNPFIPNPSKVSPTRGGVETNPDHMLMDHEEMERVDGAHLHNQNVMPQARETSGPSIVDQKLSKIFKSTSASPAPTKSYEKDPYREPLN